MALPIVAIVGRPNVGKSSLYNALVGRRASIVEPTAGVTRDRVSEICDIDDHYFELVDTGGHGIVDRDDLQDHVEQQIRYAIDQAELILFVVDAREGLNPLDTQTAELLRKHPRRDRVRLLANKVDNPRFESETAEFGRLGFGEPLAVSAVEKLGLNEMRDMIRDHVAHDGSARPQDPVMKIALVGKRNAGKSSFINALAGQDRVIVSEIPGTTRDSIDVRFEKDGRTIVAIDTAGLRKKKSLADDIEYYAYSRAENSIHRADVVLFMIDATVPVSQVDTRLSATISHALKPCILVVNKWDLARGKSDVDAYGEYLTEVLPELSYAPVSFTSANVGKNCLSSIDLASELFKQARTRVGTGPLNQVLQEALATNTPKSKRGKKSPKIFYATQVAVAPPTIVLFVNGTNLITPGYERFLLNRFREALPFSEIPIRLMYRARRGRSRPGESRVADEAVD